ncbi:MAG TPA: DASS family sodium-coupled anion symporter [Negativicutes bacterium]|nr:DASS family sodium-coupled anion symporter [Negativicutes bacterium]
MSTLTKKWLIVLGSGLLVYIIPVPVGVKPLAWNLLAVFVATIIGCIVQPIPLGAISLASLSLLGFLGLASMNELLAGFSSSTIWLIVSAFLLSRGFSKTGLGRRISYLLIQGFGDKTLKLGFAIMLSEYVFSPATPSTTARGGAIVYPIAKSLASAFDSEPGPTAKKIGAYLMQVGFQSNCMSGSLFMTAMIANPMMALFAQKAFGIQISWMDWAVAAFVPGTLAMILIPIVLYYILPPEQKITPEAPKFAAIELKNMGPMTRDEKIMLAVFLGSILLWATASITNLDATLIALGSGSVLLVTNVLTWKDVLNENGAWDAMVWVGVLSTIAGLLNKHGLIVWFSKLTTASLVGIPWMWTLVAILVIYLYSHYLFASITGHVVAMYPAFIAVAGAAGAPPMLVALSLGFFSNFFACLTHYGNGAGPIYFGSGYMSQATWWRVGFTMSVIYLGCFLGVGLPWWKAIGIW